MDVLIAPSAERQRVASVSTWRRVVWVGAAYAAVAGAAIARHEPWADEAQSWLLARDAGLVELWGRLLHYEGTAGLWQTLLHFLIALGLPYSGMNVVSGLVGLAGAVVLVWKAPFPLAVRMALPFTYFLSYQFAVIARSYALLPVLLFGCAALYPTRDRHRWWFVAMLCLMTAVSVHGMALAGAIALLALAGTSDWRKVAGPAVVFLAVMAAMAAAARPADDGTFVTGWNWDVSHFVETSQRAFAAAFTGEWISSVLLAVASLPVLWVGGTWWFFALASLALCGIDSVVYAQAWHFGILYLAWLFAMWVACARARRIAPLASALLAVLILIHGYWSVRAIGYDWEHAYSASRDAAVELRALEGRRIFAIGYACVAVEPYFPGPIFANTANYWDWSHRNHVNEDSQHLDRTRPDFVLVGYKNESEHGIWTDAVRRSGYRRIRHFEGNTFWEASVFEPESYDLFARGDSK